MKKIICLSALFLFGCTPSSVRTSACMDAWAAFCLKAEQCESIVTSKECMAEVTAQNLCGDVDTPILELHRCSIDISRMSCEDALPDSCTYFRK